MTPTRLLLLFAFLAAYPAAAPAQESARKKSDTGLAGEALAAAAPLPYLGAAMAKGRHKPSDPSVKPPWGDPAHVQYFNYQDFLVDKGLQGENDDTWPKGTEEARKKKIADGEALLKKRFDELMGKDWLPAEDEEFLAAVWGPKVAKSVKAVTAARGLKDPDQIKLAIGGVNALAKKLGGMKTEFLFDGKAEGGDLVDPSGEDKVAGKDYLAVDKKSSFFDSLDAPEVRKALESQKSFSAFLTEQHVPSDAMPGLLSMYSVLSKAQGSDKAQLGHILPTVVRFLKDGKEIKMEDMDGALGFAVPGEYDKPERVGITSEVSKADPIIVGKTLAHEFQHIYDMYTGRYYTIDSEMRGFKTAALYFKTLKQAAPAKYQELLTSDNDSTRRIMVDAEHYSKSLDEGPQAFFQAVAFGHHYSKWEEGVFEGRAPLKEAVDPDLGAPRELGSLRVLRAQAKAHIAELEGRQEDVRAQREAKASRELDKELEKVTNDLKGARSQYDYYDAESTLKEIRVRRMQSELDWMNKKAKKENTPDQPFDLNLPVDKDYVTP